MRSLLRWLLAPWRGGPTPSSNAAPVAPPPASLELPAATAHDATADIAHWVERQAMNMQTVAAAFATAIRLPPAAFATAVAHMAKTLTDAAPAAWLRQFGLRLDLPHASMSRLADLPPEHRWAAWALASLAANGHVRQLAVERIGHSGHGSGLQHALPRTSDWVPEVRAAALRSSESLLANTPTAALFAIVNDTLAWLEARRHSEARTLAARLRAELAQPARRDALLQVLCTHGSPHRRRLFVMLADGLDDATRQRLVNDPESGMRATFATWLVQRCDPAAPVHAGWIRHLLADRSRQVRLAIIHHLDAQAAMSRLDQLLPLCFERHRALRRAAAAAVIRAGVDLAAECRRRLLGDEPPQAGLVLCLGEHGGPDDAPRLERWLHAGPSLLQGACLEALGQLQPNAWTAAAIAAIGSGDAVQERAGVRVLRRAERWRWIPAVREIALAGGPASTVAFRLATERGQHHGWDAMADMLLSIVHCPSLRDCGWNRLMDWCSMNLPRGWLRPDASQRSWLTRAWADWQRVGPEVPMSCVASFAALREWILAELAGRAR